MSGPGYFLPLPERRAPTSFSSLSGTQRWAPGPLMAAARDGVAQHLRIFQRSRHSRNKRPKANDDLLPVGLRRRDSETRTPLDLSFLSFFSQLFEGLIRSDVRHLMFVFLVHNVPLIFFNHSQFSCTTFKAYIYIYIFQEGRQTLCCN